MTTQQQQPLLTAPLPIQTSGWGLNSFVIAIVLPFLATIAVCLRFFARHVSHAGFQISDKIMLAALVAYYLLCVVALVGLIYGGFGRNIETLSESVVENAAKVLLPAQNMYALSLALAKLSGLALLLKVFGDLKRNRVMIWAAMGLTVSWFLMASLISFLICRPLAYNWDRTLEGTCGNEYAAFGSVAVVDVIVDLVILLLPATMIAKLSLPTTSRLALTVVFTFGFTDLVSATLRLVGSLKVNFTGNFTQTFGSLYFWSIFEPGLAIIVASIITMTPLFDHFHHRRRLRRLDSTASSTEDEKSDMTDDFFGALRKMDGSGTIEFRSFAGTANTPASKHLRFIDSAVNVTSEVIVQTEMRRV